MPAPLLVALTYLVGLGIVYPFLPFQALALGATPWQVSLLLVTDTAVILLRFAGGALGTVTLSDTTAAPWSWEQTARENPDYPPTGQDCYRIAGTHGALALPEVALWRHPEARSWFAPISATRFPTDIADPLVRQAEQFGAVVRDGAAPLVPGADGLRALRVVEAVKAAAASGAAVDLEDPA